MRRTTLAACSLAAVALLTAAATHAKAQGFESAYCTSGGWATDHTCGFNTFEQCMAFVHGVGGSCAPNPRATHPTNPPVAQRPMRSRR